MTRPRFKPGDRVRISQDCHWAVGALATVQGYPGAVETVVAVKTDGSHFRDVPGVRGVIRFYWVALDEPQIDADGDGPYVQAEFAEEDLLLVAPAT